nr:hypothetical protein HmN_000770100 [Hymenolepis microstoma]
MSNLEYEGMQHEFSKKRCDAFLFECHKVDVHSRDSSSAQFKRWQQSWPVLMSLTDVAPSDFLLTRLAQWHTAGWLSSTSARMKK